MEHLTFDIRSRDYGAAGAASRELKQHLKRIGAEPDAVRRAMIAAYEAEMNVVIHADGGRLEATVTDGQLDVDVIDQGPGIADIEQAMTEGWSTASSEARALGFGAGMGLPNIARNSDRLNVSPTAAGGTSVSFSIMLRPIAAGLGGRPTSLGIAAASCRDCRHCLVACPTAALRVRDGQPAVMNHLCIDCTCCIAACPTQTLSLMDPVPSLGDGAGRILAVPPALLAGFGRDDTGAVVDALASLGFAEIVPVHGYEAALRRAVLDHAASAGVALPVISPACPAAVNLIELRFPALLPYIAPFVSPWEALQQDFAGHDITYVVSCPSQRTALLAQEPTEQRRIVTTRLVREALLPLLAERHGSGGGEPATEPMGATQPAPLQVTGATHVAAVLEAIEDDRLPGVRAVELSLCDGGCFGSPLLAEDGHVAAWRWATGGGLPSRRGMSAPRSRPYRQRPGIRLDPDMAVAIEKLHELDAELATLPHKDCGVCGAPTCAALAEDLVMGRASRALCPYAAPKKETAP